MEPSQRGGEKQRYKKWEGRRRKGTESREKWVPTNRENCLGLRSRMRPCSEKIRWTRICVRHSSTFVLLSPERIPDENRISIGPSWDPRVLLPPVYRNNHLLSNFCKSHRTIDRSDNIIIQGVPKVSKPPSLQNYRGVSTLLSYPVCEFGTTARWKATGSIENSSNVDFANIRFYKDIWYQRCNKVFVWPNAHARVMRVGGGYAQKRGRITIERVRKSRKKRKQP